MASDSHRIRHPLPFLGGLVIADDGHHTFVAVPKVGVPILLMRVDTNYIFGIEDWTEW